MTGWDEHGHAVMTGTRLDQYLGAGELQDAENCGYAPVAALSELGIDTRHGDPQTQYRDGRIVLTDGAVLQRGGAMGCVWAVAEPPDIEFPDLHPPTPAEVAGHEYAAELLTRAADRISHLMRPGCEHPFSKAFDSVTAGIGGRVGDYVKTMGPEVGSILVAHLRGLARQAMEIGPDPTGVRLAAAMLEEDWAAANARVWAEPVRRELAKLDGTDRAAVALLSGMAEEQIDEHGGMP